MFCVIWNETEASSLTRGMARQHSDSSGRKTRKPKALTLLPPLPHKITKAQPHHHQSQKTTYHSAKFNRGSYCIKKKCIHLKKGWGSGDSKGGGSHPWPWFSEAEKSYSSSLRPTMCLFFFFFFTEMWK